MNFWNFVIFQRVIRDAILYFACCNYKIALTCHIDTHIYGGCGVIICKLYFKYEMRKRNEILMMKVIWKLKQN